jgi:hypothetical protein
MEAMQSQMAAKEDKRQALIIRLVEYVNTEIGDNTDNHTEAVYITQKVAGVLLAKALETFDQAMMLRDLQTLKT